MVSKSSELFNCGTLSSTILGWCGIPSLNISLCRNSGIGQAYWQVILGRLATGCGASGIVSLASIIITGEMITPLPSHLSLCLLESPAGI